MHFETKTSDNAQPRLYKKLYQKPELQVLGDVATMTASGSPDPGENNPANTNQLP